MSALLLTLAAVAAAEAAPLALENLPRCVVADRYPIVSVALPEDAGTAAARLRFRTRDEWFAVIMRPTGGRMEAVLPRPKSGLREFWYQVATVDDSGVERSSPELTARVTRPGESCGEGSTAKAVETPPATLIVDAPTETRHGKAASSRLVPQGFSPKGVAGDIGMFDLSAPVAIAGGVVLTGGLAAAAAFGGDHENKVNNDPLPPITMTVALTASEPPPGGGFTVSTQLILSLAVTPTARVEGGRLRVLFLSGTSSCGELNAFTNSLPGQQPTTVTVAGQLRNSPCSAGTQIDTLGIIYEAFGSHPVTVTTPELHVSYTVQP